MAKWQEMESLILRYIADKGLRLGDKLPSDKEFAAMGQCSLQPVIFAMQALHRKGVVQRRRGTATTVQEQQSIADDHNLSFGHAAAGTYGQEVETRTLELKLRLPQPGENLANETAARRFLGLRTGEPFYVISRLRILNREPRVIHTSYLNPHLLSDDFLAKHDFEQGSLIAALNANGYQIERRTTILTARFPSEEERIILRVGSVPVLGTQQRTQAKHIQTKAVVNIEFLCACYANWEYRVDNRYLQGGGL